MSNAIATLLPKLLPAMLVVVGLVAALVVQLGIAVDVFMQGVERRTRMFGVLRVVNGVIAFGALVVLLGAVAGATYGLRRIVVKPANMTVPEGYEPAKP